MEEINNAGPSTPVTSQAAPKKSGMGKKLGIGCGGLIVLLVLFVIGYQVFVPKEERERITAEIEAERALDRSKDSAERVQKAAEKAAEAERIAAADSAASYKAAQSDPDNVEILKTDWEVGGFGTVALARLQFKNNSTLTAKDIVVRFDFVGESGAILSSARETFSVIIPPGKTKRTDKVNLGIISEQSKGLRSTVENVTFQ